MYTQTDLVAKQNLVLQAATNSPQDAINLCQADARSRKACNLLPEHPKAEICLKNNQLAGECDKIPMYSKDQFLRLIPAQIEIFPNDPLQIRHEFYSRNYKLPTDGFARALYKAKVINTVCALIRPQILITHSSEFPPLPPYMNASLIDMGLALFEKLEKDDSPDNRVNLSIEVHGSIEFKNVNNGLPLLVNFKIETDYYIEKKSYDYFSFSVSTNYGPGHSKIPESVIKANQILYDLSQAFRDDKLITTLMGEDFSNMLGNIYLEFLALSINLDDPVEIRDIYPNTFVISRILLHLLDAGFSNIMVKYHRENMYSDELYPLTEFDIRTDKQLRLSKPVI